MASIYILYSKKLGKFYTGSCKDLSYGIEQYINHEFTKSYTLKADDWNLFYFADNLKYEQARSIENHIKKMKSEKYIQNLKNYPEILEKLKNAYP